MRDDQSPYLTRIEDDADGQGSLVFHFVPVFGPGMPVPGSIRPRVPEHVAFVETGPEGLEFDWSRTPDDPGNARAELEAEARRRFQARSTWIARMGGLIAEVERWAEALGWSTRRIEKRLDDPFVGDHVVPALLMQEGTCRVLLEPIGRSAPGSEGLADLYRLPRYDDIAHLSFADEVWVVREESPGDPSPRPFTEEALRAVLDGLRVDAA